MNDIGNAPMVRRLVDDRTTLLEATPALARLAFGLAIVLSPFRGRFVLSSRPRPPIYRDFTDVLVFWSELAVLATLVLWAVSLAWRRRPIERGPGFLRWPVGALLGVMWIGSIFSLDPALSFHLALRSTVLAALGVFVLNEVRNVTRMLPAVIAMILLHSLVAIGQVLGQGSIGWRGLGEYDLDPAVGGVSVVTSLEGDRLLRGYGLSDHPNILGGLLVLGLLVVLAALPRAGELTRVFAVLALGFGSIAAALTFSRAAALGAAVGYSFVLVGLAMRRKRSALRWWVVGGAVALVAVAVLAEPYGQYFRVRSDTGSISVVATEQRSLDERAALAEATNEVIIDNAVLGTGLGTIPQAIRQADSQFTYDYQPAHVVLLDVAAELGLVGALAYAITVGAPWVAMWIRRRQLEAELITASAVLAAITTIGWFDYYPWSNVGGQLWFWVALGLWAAAWANLLERAGGHD